MYGLINVQGYDKAQQYYPLSAITEREGQPDAAGKGATDILALTTSPPLSFSAFTAFARLQFTC